MVLRVLGLKPEASYGKLPEELEENTGENSCEITLEGDLEKV